MRGWFWQRGERTFCFGYRYGHVFLFYFPHPHYLKKKTGAQPLLFLFFVRSSWFYLKHSFPPPTPLKNNSYFLVQYSTIIFICGAEKEGELFFVHLSTQKSDPMSGHDENRFKVYYQWRRREKRPKCLLVSPAYPTRWGHRVEMRPKLEPLLCFIQGVQHSTHCFFMVVLRYSSEVFFLKVKFFLHWSLCDMLVHRSWRVFGRTLSKGF